ncbi:ABC transporter permease [Enemella sp. A6]|uniref:ABC transporter permease n=1 Tax=Enemella sp. A6 TaxID=3440152 RepID=UPI003EB871F8
MTTLDLSPAPGAAPTAGRIWAHGRTEAMLLARNGEQLLLALVIPVVLLLLGRFAGGRVGLDDPNLVPPSVFAVAIWSSAFNSLAIATGFERRYGVLERLSSTPLGRAGLITGKAVSLLLVTAGQLLVLAVVAFILGWRPVFSVPALLVAIVAAALAVLAFAAWALVLAGRLRAEITLALGNLIYLIFLIGGAVFLPVAAYPDVVQPVLSLLPTAALGEALRHAAAGEIVGWPLAVLSVWAALGLLVSRKVFRWSS